MGRELYSFGTASSVYLTKSDKDVLGGKGAGLLEMAQKGYPVPPGFVFSISWCKEWQATTNQVATDKLLDDAVHLALEKIERLTEMFGFTPLLSVRSGAPVSMPGMMDTILNVGMTSDLLPKWETLIGQRAALDSYRRLIQMLGHTAFGIPAEVFGNALNSAKAAAKVSVDSDLDVASLIELVAHYKKLFQAATQKEFPDSLPEQLRAAIRAVWSSWEGERASIYRQLNEIPATMGTAVTVQSMVFGNMNELSGSGVLFTRDPSTGKKEMLGEFLPNAQGEDVVAGSRTPMSLAQMNEMWPAVGLNLAVLAGKLETDYRDMVDIEFTVQNGELFLLQSRVGKRSGYAAIKIAHDLMVEKMITPKLAKMRLKGDDFLQAFRTVIDPSFDVRPDAVGIYGSVGIAKGVPVFTAADALDCKKACILVRQETDPNDIGGMNAAAGILTATGGQTSHAAVVARGMNKSAVVGLEGIVEKVRFENPKIITIDGASGRVWFDVEVPVISPTSDPAVSTMLALLIGSKRINLRSPDDLSLYKKVLFSTADMASDADLGVAFAAIETAMKKNPDLNVVINLRKKDDLVPKDDVALMAFAPIVELNVLEILAKFPGLAKATMIHYADSTPELAAAGFKIPKLAHTVDDVMNGGYLTVAPGLTAVISEANLLRLLDLLNNSGVAVSIPAPFVEETCRPAAYYALAGG